MKKLIALSVFIPMAWISFSQSSYHATEIKQMKWGLDYQVYLRLNNDSAYALNIESLFHVLPKDNQFQKPEFTYYPVRFDSTYIEKLRERYPTCLLYTSRCV